MSTIKTIDINNYDEYNDENDQECFMDKTSYEDFINEEYDSLDIPDDINKTSDMLHLSNNIKKLVESKYNLKDDIKMLASDLPNDIEELVESNLEEYIKILQYKNNHQKLLKYKKNQNLKKIEQLYEKIKKNFDKNNLKKKNKIKKYIDKLKLNLKKIKNDDQFNDIVDEQFNDIVDNLESDNVDNLESDNDDNLESDNDDHLESESNNNENDDQDNDIKNDNNEIDDNDNNDNNENDDTDETVNENDDNDTDETDDEKSEEIGFITGISTEGCINIDDLPQQIKNKIKSCGLCGKFYEKDMLINEKNKENTCYHCFFWINYHPSLREIADNAVDITIAEYIIKCKDSHVLINCTRNSNYGGCFLCEYNLGFEICDIKNKNVLYNNIEENTITDKINNINNIIIEL